MLSTSQAIHSILLIEDDPYFRRCLRSMINRETPHDISWYMAGTIEAAKSILDRESVDMILLDLNLPDSQGMDTWHVVRDVAADTAIVIVSGDDGYAKSGSAFMVDGAQEFIIKGQELKRDLYQTLTHALYRQNAMVALQQATQQLADQQHLTALGLLAGGVAHEFNNLNAIIMGYAERLLESDEVQGSVRSGLERILTAVCHSADVTKGLLGLVRRDEQHSVIDVRRVVDDTLTIIRRSLERGNIDVHIQQPSGPVQVMGSRGQLGQALMNLLINARDALQGQLERRIEVRVCDSDERYIRIEVEDNGPGIDENVKTKLFKPFVTTKRDLPDGAHGYGLGLATVRTIVDGHDGSISCESAATGGAVFVINIPRCSYQDADHSDETAFEPVSCRGNVLVVEDEVELSGLMLDSLSKVGLRVDVAVNGVAALELLSHNHYDLLIVDRQMPVMDGLVFLHSVVDTYGALPSTIVCSGWLQDDDRLAFEQLGVARTLNKPVRADELVQAVATCLAAGSETTETVFKREVEQ